jgi:putative transposase
MRSFFSIRQDGMSRRSCRCPKSPELNPVENIWQFMRDNWLSNRVFKSYDDILDHCCFAWNKLIDMPWKIMSIGTRQWAYRS